MKLKYAIGVDIGGTNTKLGVVDEKGTVLKRHDFKTTDYKDFATYVEALERAITFLTSNTDGDCQGVGIGAPTATTTRALSNTPRTSRSDGACRLSKRSAWLSASTQSA